MSSPNSFKKPDKSFFPQNWQSVTKTWRLKTSRQNYRSLVLKWANSWLIDAISKKVSTICVNSSVPFKVRNSNSAKWSEIENPPWHHCRSNQTLWWWTSSRCINSKTIILQWETCQLSITMCLKGLFSRTRVKIQACTAARNSNLRSKTWIDRCLMPRKNKNHFRSLRTICLRSWTEKSWRI